MRPTDLMDKEMIAANVERIVELARFIEEADREAPLVNIGAEGVRKRRTMVAELDQRRSHLASDFGSRLGWGLTKEFTLEELGRGTGSWRTLSASEFVNQPTFFGEPNWPNRPAAIAAHNWGPRPASEAWSAEELKEYAAELTDYATPFDLEATIVTGFPSWYRPGRTTLVVYRSLKRQKPFGDDPLSVFTPTEADIRQGEEDVADALAEGA